MFANMKTATKVVAGFGAMLIILAGLGTIGYVMFGKVNTNVSALEEHSLAAVKNSTGVERAAFQTIAQEKNYLLHNNDEYHQAAKKYLGELNASLDSVDKVAKQFDDVELGKKSKDVRSLAANYGKLYDQGVAALKNNKAGEATMNAKGSLVLEEATAYMGAKKTEYMEGKNALSIVNQINATALSIRLNFRQYIATKEQRLFDDAQKQIGELNGYYNDLEKLHPDAAEQKQITDARTATAEYQAAAKKWYDLDKSATATAVTMETAYAAVMKCYETFIDDKNKDYKASTNDETRAKNFEIFTVGSTIADYANATALYSKKFMMDGKAENWKAVSENLDKLEKVYAELRKLTTDEMDVKLVDTAEKATQEYQAAAKTWYDNYQKQQEALTALVTAGQTVAKNADNYKSAKETNVNKIADAVFIVANIRYIANLTRLNEKNYINNQDPKEWSGLNENLTKLLGLYKDLEKVSLTEEDKQRIARADKATQEYFAAAKSWVENDNTLREKILPEMKKAGDTVLATAQTAENDAWKASDEAGSSVLGVVTTSKFIIVVTLLTGVVVALALGFFISKSISKMLATLIGETNRLCEATVEGKLQTRGNPEAVSLEFRPMIDGTNNLIEAFVNPINVTADYVDQISKGNIPVKITDNYNGDFNKIKNNLNQCIDVMNGLLEETNTLIQATQDGKLQTRGNAQQFPGGWGELVGGVNRLIDAFVAPINVTADYVDRISAGNIPTKITDNYNGDFNKIKNNLNRCIDAVNGLISEAKTLSSAAASGELDVRADDAKYQGDYREIIRGMNSTLQGFATPVNEIGETLKKMASKDFSHPVRTEYPGAYGELRNNVNSVVKNISSAIEQINESANQFAEGSRVIAESSQSLASGAQTQSSSVEEMSASIEELARSVDAVKENATQATVVANEANQLAEEGGKAVQKSVESMELIRTSSQQISEIIQVISEIASQTNLLALNAAIEAARAGEHGMGFAVVADEVRKLAERSNQAAREISTLIKESTQRVEEGAQLSDQTGESLKQIISAAEATAAKIAEIAAATVQQAANAGEVAKAIQSVAQVTEQSAAGSEEMASSSEELGAQSTALRELVGAFNVSTSN